MIDFLLNLLTLRVALISILIVLSPSLLVQAQWNQFGADINGEFSGDYSGQSVSLSADGLNVAIGSPLNSGGGIARGQVRVYKSVNSNWTQLGLDISGEADSDLSGGAVSLSADGKTLAVGAAFNDGEGIDRGHVRVYKLINDSWIQLGLDIDGKTNNDNSGNSISLSADGTSLAIGASENAGGGVSRGHVRVFKFVLNSWVQIGPDIHGEVNNDKSGNAVSLSFDGRIIAIGAKENSGGGIGRGQVRVFKLMNGIWIQQGADINGESDLDKSGSSVSLSYDGYTVAIGAPFNNNNGSERGQVRVFKFINDEWIQQGMDINGEDDEDNSGSAVAISSDGTILAIGAAFNSGVGKSSGHVRVFKKINDEWIQQGADIEGEAEDDLSGRSVALSSDGTLVTIGAPGSNSGHVRVFYFGPVCNSPSIICPSDIIVNTQPDLCNAVVNYIDSTSGIPYPAINYSMNGATLNVGIGNGSGTIFNKGVTQVTLTALNICGSQNCIFTVTVNDNQKPSIQCPTDITQNTEPGTCRKTVMYSATTNDNCSETRISFSPPSGSVFNIGLQYITAIVADESDNADECIFTVTIIDTENPIITCPSDIIQSAASGSCNSIVSFAASATDNCSEATISYSPSNNTSFNIGTTNVTAIATDSSGNFAHCTFTITIQDHESPVITCPSNITQSTAIGTCSAYATFIAASIDNCSTTSIEYSPENGSSFNMGITIVKAISKDTSGNIAECAFTITIIDDEDPIIICPSNIIKPPVIGVDSQKVVFTAIATDNCGVSIVTFSPASGSLFYTGTTTVTAMAKDENGNSSICTFAVTVEEVAPYKITDLKQVCYLSTFCIPVTAVAKVNDIIGYDVVLTYDPLLVYPTGIIKTSNDLIDSTLVDVAYSIDDIAARINISAYIKGSAPSNSIFSGRGDIFCVQFAKKPVFGNVDTAIFNIVSLTESYTNGTKNKIANSGQFTTYKDSLYFASLRFWADDSPIIYIPTKPDDYLITSIYSNDETCENKLDSIAQPDTTGNFIYNILKGLNIEIVRDILSTTSMQPLVNGFDALQIRRLINSDPTFSPNIYQMIAMDVNMDGLISEKDISQINQRAVSMIPEFKQVWNHTEDGGLSDLPSKDWIFVDALRIATNLAYQMSSLYPSDDGIGFSKYRVPVTPFCLPVNVLNFSDCPLLRNEIYRGILLGDVNGNYQNIRNDGMLRSNNKMVFDLSAAVINGDYIDIPVSIHSSEPVNALDFSMQFNNSKLIYNSVISHSSDIQALDFFNPKDKTLRFTSNSPQDYDIAVPVISIHCKLVNGNISASDLVPIATYLNGVQVDVEVRMIIETSNLQKDIFANIYPNPATGIVNIVLKKDAIVQVFDLNGKRLISSTKIKAMEKQEFNVDLLANGIYFMKIYNGSTVATKIIVISK